MGGWGWLSQLVDPAPEMAPLKTAGNEILKIRVRGPLTLCERALIGIHVQMYISSSSVFHCFSNKCVSVKKINNIRKYEESAIVQIFSSLYVTTGGCQLRQPGMLVSFSLGLCDLYYIAMCVVLSNVYKKCTWNDFCSVCVRLLQFNEMNLLKLLIILPPFFISHPLKLHRDSQPHSVWLPTQWGWLSQPHKPNLTAHIF